ncbi:HAD family hydrolase [Agilicoccus flavus]|uniref:HAD family hydrolase n=1 Tax=Agilicoccus flavus TaxID=2775968 RepID=UPI001CF6403A|nr:beta-phosphoglucomutase family hydrolase [Agilicoccus flavus]
MDWIRYDAALFDLDGVLTPTALVHMAAWAETFDAFLAGRGQPAYTEQDYYDHVDGRPRYEGVATFLASRGIELPYGDPSDPPEADTVCGIGNRKNVAVNEVLDRDGVDPYPGSLRLLDHLGDAGIRMAVVSSSANAPHVLKVSGIADRFEVVVDGAVAARDGLPGKPEPDTFLAAADRLGVAADRAVVLEDATSGVRAGKAGGFGLVVGVDRGAGPQALSAAGADVVVADLAELLP